MNYLAVDTEYSSFYSAERHKSGELLQLAIVPVINGIEGEPFNEFCRPLTRVWNSHAEKVHGISRKKAESFQHPKEMADKLREWLSKLDKMFYGLGHNHKGDKQYVERLVSDYKMTLEWHRKVRFEWKDTKDIATKLKEQLSVKNVKLETLARYFKLDINAHDALSDARVTSQVYQLLDAMISAKQGRQQMIDSESELEKRKKYLDLKYISMGGDGTVFLTEFCTQNREALRVCLEEIWTVYGEV